MPVQTNSDELRKQVESAANTALTVMHFNGVTQMADKAFRNVMSVTGISSYDVIWRMDYITVSYTVNGKSEIIIKPINSIGTSLNGLYNTMTLSENVKDGKVSIENLNSELQKVIGMPFDHKRFVYILLDGLAAAFYLKFHHGTWLSILIVFIAAMIGESVRYRLQKRDVPGNRILFIAGLISACFTGFVLHFGFGVAEITTLIASIIYLVPGLRMINGFIDLTNLKYTFIGAQRLLNAFYLLLILAFVVMIADTIILLKIF